jgi:hypothetical protein
MGRKKESSKEKFERRAREERAKDAKHERLERKQPSQSRAASKMPKGWFF